MATVFTTEINSCRVTSQGDLTDVVKEVNVTITGTDDVVTSCTFSLPIQVKFGEADPQSFTPFEDITQTEMIDWVNAQTDQIAPVQAHIEYVLQQQLAIAALTPKPLPWVPEPTPTPEPTPMPESAPPVKMPTVEAP